MNAEGVADAFSGTEPGKTKWMFDAEQADLFARANREVSARSEDVLICGKCGRKGLMPTKG